METGGPTGASPGDVWIHTAACAAAVLAALAGTAVVILGISQQDMMKH